MIGWYIAFRRYFESLWTAVLIAGAAEFCKERGMHPTMTDAQIFAFRAVLIMWSLQSIRRFLFRGVKLIVTKDPPEERREFP